MKRAKSGDGRLTMRREGRSLEERYVGAEGREADSEEGREARRKGDKLTGRLGEKSGDWSERG